MEERRFDGVWIPREIWLDNRLNALDKVILTEIHSLDNSEDHCFAGNEYLAEFCQCSTSKVTKTVSKLIELGYIKVHSFDGRIRRLRSCITIHTTQNSKIYDSDEQNVLSINITSSEKSKNTQRKREKSVFSDGFDDFWSAYPRHVKKKTAFEAWLKLKPDEELRKKIIADIIRRKSSEWSKTDIRYIPHPSTYLNQRRWEDEVIATDTADDEYYPTYQEYHEGDEFIEPEGCTPVGGRR